MHDDELVFKVTLYLLITRMLVDLMKVGAAKVLRA
jgi:hypothetical protein